MGENIKDLRQRVKSIKSTKKITRAMEMVSAAKLRRTQGMMDSAKPFMRKLEMLLGRLSRSPVAQENPLFQTREGQELPKLFVLFTADRGLCGAFNANLIKLAEKRLKANPGSLLYCVGRKGYDYFKKRLGPERLVGQELELGGKIDGPKLHTLSKELKSYWDDGKVEAIELVCSEFVSTATNDPVVSRFWPLEASAFEQQEEGGEQAIDYLLEPSPEAVFEALLPQYLSQKILLTVAETYTSEHASRMLAMNNATKNCDELSETLTLQMNKARQAAITTEIVEIVSGAEALEG